MILGGARKDPFEEFIQSEKTLLRRIEEREIFALIKKYFGIRDVRVLAKNINLKEIKDNA